MILLKMSKYQDMSLYIISSSIFDEPIKGKISLQNY